MQRRLPHSSSGRSRARSGTCPLTSRQPSWPPWSPRPEVFNQLKWHQGPRPRSMMFSRLWARAWSGNIFVTCCVMSVSVAQISRSCARPKMDLRQWWRHILPLHGSGERNSLFAGSNTSTSTFWKYQHSWWNFADEPARRVVWVHASSTWPTVRSCSIVWRKDVPVVLVSTVFCAGPMPSSWFQNASLFIFGLFRSGILPTSQVGVLNRWKRDESPPSPRCWHFRQDFEDLPAWSLTFLFPFEFEWNPNSTFVSPIGWVFSILHQSSIPRRWIPHQRRMGA